MKPSKEVTEFVFQEIPMAEAVNAIIAGEGNYADIKGLLLTKLPEIEARNRQNNAEQKAFSFGLPKNHEVPEVHQRGICMAINATLRRAGLSWHVTYSGLRKLFICVPKKRPAESQGVKQREGVTKGPYNKNTSTWTTPAPEAKKAMEQMIEDACRLFKVFREDISKGRGYAKLVRKAICKVGIAHHIHEGIIAANVGLTPGGVVYNAKTENNIGKEEIKKLSEHYRSEA